MDVRFGKKNGSVKLAVLAALFPGTQSGAGGNGRTWMATLQRTMIGSLVVTLAITAPAGVTTGADPDMSPAAADQVSEGWIAYGARSGLSPVYLVRPGGSPQLVIPGAVGVGNDVVCPTFSPDGTLLAVGMPGGSIVVLSVDETGLTEVDPGRLREDVRVAETPHCPAWAPDSSAVAFLDGETLVITHLDGPGQAIDEWDTSTGAKSAAFLGDYPPDRAVAWSPDGSVIAVARPSGTWLLPVGGAAPQRINRAPAYSVSWSPNGARLVVGSADYVKRWRRVRGPTSAPASLVIRAADGVTETTLPSVGGASWSPVDDRIAYGGGEVVVVKPDGTERLVVDEDGGGNVTWSPDGRRVMYIRDVGGTVWQLLARAADGTGDPEIIVPMVTIPTARSFPASQQFSWQPVP